MKTKLITIIAILVLCACAATQMTTQQEDGIARSTGNALAFAVTLAKPELVPALKAYCVNFAQVKDILECKALMETALTMAAGKYTDDPKLGMVAMNLLRAIGFSEEKAQELVFAEVDKAIEIENFTEKMYHLTLMAASGFCEML